AHHAHATLGFASQHGADFDPLDSGSLNHSGELFGDLLIDVNHGVAVVVFQFFERHAANDAIAKRFNDFPSFNDPGDVNSVDRSAVVLADDDVLSHVDQAASEVARIGGLERRVGQALAGSVSRDEVFQHGQTFTEVRRDGRLDDFTGRFRHQ